MEYKDYEESYIRGYIEALIEFSNPTNTTRLIEIIKMLLHEVRKLKGLEDE